jgi:hypothetical protein
MIKYAIQITLWNYGNPKPHIVTEYFFRFDNEQDARIALLEQAIEEANRFNNPYDDDGEYIPQKAHFEVDLEGGDRYDAVVRCWISAEDYMNVTGYKIIRVDEEEN